MEWVETTGKTIEEAKEAALDRLGVDEADAEFEVVQEPKVGLFGRVRTEARVRARVRPTTPRAKQDRRERRRRSKPAAEVVAGGSPAERAAERPAARTAGGGGGGTGGGQRGRSGGARPSSGAHAGGSEMSPGGSADEGTSPRTNPSRKRRRGRGHGGGSVQPDRVATSGGDGAGGRRPANADTPEGFAEALAEDGEEGTMDVALDEQGRVAETFLRGLVDAFGLDATIAVHRPTEDAVELELTGDGLGMLIGPRGATLLAIQDLTRTVVQHKTSAGNGRIHVDVGGYRQKRSEALARFARKVANDALSSRTRIALEPMPAADRKVVHDALTDVEGVSTVSEGEEPRRRVVIVPSPGTADPSVPGEEQASADAEVAPPPATTASSPDD